MHGFTGEPESVYSVDCEPGTNRIVRPESAVYSKASFTEQQSICDWVHQLNHDYFYGNDRYCVDGAFQSTGAGLASFVLFEWNSY